MKREIKLWDYAGQILEGVQKAALVTTKADGKVNAMTIGWGTLGIEWSKPIFILFVRESRYTMEMLEKNPEFTINIPMGDVDKNILKMCGTKSGRDMDKIKELGKQPSTTPINTNAKTGGGNGDNYSSWREQMRNLLLIRHFL